MFNMKTLKKFKLHNTEVFQDDIIKNSRLKNILGGYGNGTYTITCKGQDSVGCCNTYECTGTCEWCKNKAIETGCIESTISFNPSCG